MLIIQYVDTNRILDNCEQSLNKATIICKIRADCIEQSAPYSFSSKTQPKNPYNLNLRHGYRDYLKIVA